GVLARGFQCGADVRERIGADAAGRGLQLVGGVFHAGGRAAFRGGGDLTDDLLRRLHERLQDFTERRLVVAEGILQRPLVDDRRSTFLGGGLVAAVVLCRAVVLRAAIVLGAAIGFRRRHPLLERADQRRHGDRLADIVVHARGQAALGLPLQGVGG